MLQITHLEECRKNLQSGTAECFGIVFHKDALPASRGNPIPQMERMCTSSSAERYGPTGNQEDFSATGFEHRDIPSKAHGNTFLEMPLPIYNAIGPDFDDYPAQRMQSLPQEVNPVPFVS